MDEISLTRFGQAALIAALISCLGALTLALGILSRSTSAILPGFGVGAFEHSLLSAFLAGIAVTVVLQSSSVTSVLIINLVATSQLSTQAAIAAIFGANVGTVVTPLLLSFAFRRHDFQSAQTVAWQHALFNLAGAATLLPLELVFHPLYRLAHWIAPPDSHIPDPLPAFSNPLGLWSAILAIVVMLLLMRLIRFLSQRLYQGTGRPLLDGSDTLGLLLGVSATMLLQLSAAAISTVAGMGIKPKNSLPVVLGANIGTTLTAVLAAMALEGPLQAIALLVALVHLLFNLVGSLLVLLVTPIRSALIRAAEWVARRCARQPALAFSGIVLSWVVLPLLGVSLEQ
ncbi:Na/Pi symporter [Corynebacterium gerontici]|uniref:Na+/Pi-cotransporter n=1 Tax=Corynebacterium gerontici TaxID=2079234 RepID=A0A3G6IY62_9CORY|nr:Na/Pi symporter [Corynebacterium gerontici]AZA10632.1 Na+/Pi-cotransporter [Corynebacterium gerontici]